jgi:hypothetical protein
MHVEFQRVYQGNEGFFFSRIPPKLGVRGYLSKSPFYERPLKTLKDIPSSPKPHIGFECS